jgi:hypothetical protein
MLLSTSRRSCAFVPFLPITLIALAFCGSQASAQACDLHEYKAAAGLTAEAAAGGVQITWIGEHGANLRAAFDVRDGQPIIRELAVMKPDGGAWTILAKNLTPEFDVVSGKRRMSQQQLNPVQALKIPITPELVEREKWNAFWDAPLNLPGQPGQSMDLPRRPEEIRRGASSFSGSKCAVKSAPGRLSVDFTGLTLSIFTGRLRFTIYRGSNLLRQEAVASTQEQSVAYKYNAGLRGFSIDGVNNVAWQDTSRAWQRYEFGGAVNRDPVALRARNRLELIETTGGTIAVFPPSHKFFFAREIELNLGYVWYRKDDEHTFSAGVRQAEHEEEYRPYGVSDDVWKRRSEQSRHNLGNFALYNAPPGSEQHMAVYYYLSPGNAVATHDRVLAYTHGDTYKAVPGYQVAISHFHTHFNEQLTDAGTIDLQPTWWPVFRALGINIAMMSDFHGDSHQNDPGPLRFAEEKVYFDGCRRHSDRSFLIMPGEEPDGHLGGHYTMIFPKPVFWSHVRQTGQSFEQQDPTYGKVYHVGSADEELKMMQQEGALMWQAHPRTKGSTGYPDAVKDKAHFLSDRFLGGSYQSLPVDQSEARICEKRCLGVLDDMNNWRAAAGPADASSLRYMIAEGDTYMKYPDDETFPQLIVNYVKLDKLPRFDDDWSPILKAMRAGDFFVSTGEVLLRNYGLQGKAFAAEVEWTFPLEMVELVWGDGATTGSKIIPATELGQFGTHRFVIPFDPAGKKWVRFAAWDTAGNGALTQPVAVK